jgi:hypothetical protein
MYSVKQNLCFRARRSQLHSLQSRIRELTGQVEERDARLATLATRLQEANNIKKELAKYKVPVSCTSPSLFLCPAVLPRYRLKEANKNKKELAKYKAPCTSARLFHSLVVLRIRLLVGWIRIQDTKIEKGEEMSCFEGMDVLF